MIESFNLMIIVSLYLAHFTTGPLYMFYILAVVTFPVAVAKSGIALLQVVFCLSEEKILSQTELTEASEKGIKLNHSRQSKIKKGLLFRDTLLLSTWLAWTPRRGRRSKRSRVWGLLGCRFLNLEYIQPCAEACRGVYILDNIHPCALSVQGLALAGKYWNWVLMSHCHCWMATVFAVYVNCSLNP